MTIRIAVILLSLLAALCDVSKAYAYSVQIMGAGGDSCGDWTTNRAQQTSSSEENWIEGYMAASEEYQGYSQKKEIGLSTDANGYVAWLDNFCRQNPATDLHIAAYKLLLAIPFRAQ